ncbi:kinesin-like protein KIN-10A [Chenopodium quinoa]|uniref:kinesin-like protein KIN-10A n=1 Tax=Chenopodium quinoa TaxID=63459 RepID=UPI000B77A6D3|nr:kinesin-like protein KIN-10A [Chenopodium quinoa]
MAPTPSSSSKSNHSHFNIIRTPQSKQRLHFNSSRIPHPSPNPNQNPNSQPAEHPVEVIGRIRNLPEPTKDDKPITNLFQIIPDQQTIRVKTEIGYRDFTLDGVSSSEDDDLDGFYKKFIESRILGVKMGAKCTIMMYGPTGSGKSHTMFGCLKQPGIVYKSLKDILGDKENGEEQVGMFVQVSVLEIYNEEIYDLLSCDKNGGSFNLWSKGSASKVKLEVMGKKAKNATFISGNEAGKILKEIQKVEKRRIVRSTNCNDRSSRSHCMIILDAPTVGGRLMLVDMAGSENIEQAGQVGFEAKMQTAKINQGNTALKRVVESIANGDSHVPFRDSKLTMLLQDSFEDDKSKILMILCASPDPKETHKTISTLEYGAKAKCIVRGPHTPVKEKVGEDSASTVILGSRITAMDQFILKLQTENKQREKECSEAKKLLQKKEEEVSQLRAKLGQVGGEHVSGASEEEINEKVNERMQTLRKELDKQLEECQRMANEYVELEKRRMEEKVQRQQQEVEMLRRKLEEMEIELSRSRDGSSSDGSGVELDGIGLVKRLKEVYADEDPGMEKSMDLDMGDQDSYAREVIVGQYPTNLFSGMQGSFTPILSEKTYLSTVFEEEEAEAEDEDEKAKLEDDEVEKKVIEEKKVSTSPLYDVQLTPSSRKTRIQNIFTLCGNQRELSQRTPQCPETPCDQSTIEQSPMTPPNCSQPSFAATPESLRKNFNPSPNVTPEPMKENFNPSANNEEKGVLIEVYVKWEATKENPGKFINKLKVVKDATLADLRKLIEIHLGVDKQDFTFLSLGDPTGAPISKEKEDSLLASKLPTCNNQLGGHLACLRPAKGAQSPNVVPFTPLENKLYTTPVSCAKKLVHDSLSPSLDSSLGSTPYITLRRF